MNGTNTGSKTSSRILIVIISAIAILLIATVALILTIVRPVGEMQEKEKIEANLEELSGVDLGHENVWQYLAEYGIGDFDYRKFQSIENIFKKNYIGELPPTYEHAEETAKLYLEYFYNDNEEQNASQATVTDCLLRAYTYASGDRYAQYRNYAELEQFIDEMSGSFVGIGVEITYKYASDLTTLESITVNRVIKGSGAEEAGILAGDEIVAVDGTPVVGNTQPVIDALIKGEAGTTVEITVDRDGTKLTRTCTRRLIESSTVYYEMLENKIGYIGITAFEDNTDEYFALALDELKADGAKGLIFDVRNNLGGYVDSCVNMISELVPEGTRIASTNWKSGRVDVYTSTGDSLIDLPIVVLCNEYTASAGELFTAAIRDYAESGLINAKIVGYKTYGKGVMQTTYSYLLDGSSVTLTSATYNPPCDVNYDGIGITPGITADDPDKLLDVAVSELIPMMASDGITAA